MLGETISYLFNPLERGDDSETAESVGRGETRSCSPMILSYCGDSTEAKIMSAIRWEARRERHCVKFHSTHKDMVMSRSFSSHVVAETEETPKKLKNCK